MDVLLGDRPGPLPPAELARCYPWPSAERWLRVAMVRSLDGGVAGPDGRSRSISSDVDRAVLATIRRLSDVILVGASTVRAEPYGPLRVDEQAQAERAAAGQTAAPVIAVVSPSLDLPWSEPMFQAGAARVLVLTLPSADPEALRTARRHADVVQLPAEPLDPKDLLDALTARGLRRIVCEGGPTLVTALAGQDLVDEVDLSISPVLAGGPRTSSSSTRAPGAAPGGVRLEEFALAQVIADDGFLFTRFVARRAEQAAIRPMT